MKTFTVTFHHTTNYGAVLQSYALQQTILGMGHENVILETISQSTKRKRNISAKEILKSIFLWIVYHLRKNEVKRLRKCFSDFHKKRLILSRPYLCMKDLIEDEIDADCLITGSDQVWNFKTVPEFIDSRLLAFGKKKALRFSYAASMEKINLSEEERGKMLHALKSFSGISLREESVRKFVEHLTGRNCVRVLDPVFLLTQEKWNEFSVEPRFKGNYILCYQVQNNKKLPLFAKQLSKQTGLPVISICNGPFRWFNANYSFFDVSIEEFIGFYKNASYVLSASFHGVAMGLVYEKPVYAFVKESGGNRMMELMNSFGLDKFLIKNQSMPVPLYVEDDFSRLKEKKKEYLKQSFEFLNRMFANA